MTEERLDVICVEIGARGRLSREDAKKAAGTWRQMRRLHPEAAFMFAVDGYDDDPRALWEVPEVAAYVRTWAQLVGLDDPVTAGRVFASLGVGWGPLWDCSICVGCLATSRFSLAVSSSTNVGDDHHARPRPMLEQGSRSWPDAPQRCSYSQNRNEKSRFRAVCVFRPAKALLGSPAVRVFVRVDRRPWASPNARNRFGLLGCPANAAADLQPGPCVQGDRGGEGQA
jgi:hypothetical protein